MMIKYELNFLMKYMITMRRIIVSTLLFWHVFFVFSQNKVLCEEFLPGIYKLSIGKDTFTPYSFCPEIPDTMALTKMEAGRLPFSLSDLIIKKNERGCSVSVPLGDDEQLYGFGLQMGSFQQRGLRKRPIVNDNPLNSLGYTHAPQTFYVSTAGYGIIINTSRYTTFLCGSNEQKKTVLSITNSTENIATETTELYKNHAGGNRVYVDIPNTDGVEVFVIEGKNIKQVVERYNLMSGGGCIPPMWGLGFKYRVKGDFTSNQILSLGKYFREKDIPCDVLGIEPGWQTAVYSCSYLWNKDRFPSPESMVIDLKQKGFRTNLWEHAYVNPSSPLYDKLFDYSSDFLVWKGLVPDFTLSHARDIFADHHRKFAEIGISGFKLDECDNSNIGKGDATWGFPDMSVFPSGIDGEKMHQLFGFLYLQTMNEMYKEDNMRTYQDYRSSGLFASSIPASLYSDTYDHKEYIQMICNSSFGGLLWSPEVRESLSKEDLFHRMQTVLLSAHAVVNSWYLQYPPWLQYDKDLNNKGVFLNDKEEMENIARSLINTRMSLLPYLYATFAGYHFKGTPPFRPLVMEYPADKSVYGIDDQYLIGDWLMAAPLYETGNIRKVYFPEGIWYNFNTNEKYEGGKVYEIETPLDKMPLYVKAGAILPLATPQEYIQENFHFLITCNVYGDASLSGFSLYEDDGTTYNYEKGEYNWVHLTVRNKQGKVKRSGNYKREVYEVVNWKFIR